MAAGGKDDDEWQWGFPMCFLPCPCERVPDAVIGYATWLAHLATQAERVGFVAHLRLHNAMWDDVMQDTRAPPTTQDQIAAHARLDLLMISGGFMEEHLGLASTAAVEAEAVAHMG